MKKHREIARMMGRVGIVVKAVDNVIHTSVYKVFKVGIFISAVNKDKLTILRLSSFMKNHRKIARMMVLPGIFAKAVGNVILTSV